MGRFEKWELGGMTVRMINPVGLLFMNEEVDIAILGAMVAVETVGAAAAAAG